MAQDPPEHRRVLTALADLTHDRPDLLADFARATMRRVPASLLLAADPPATARRLRDAFDAIDARRGDDVVVRVRRPGTGLDGRPTDAAVIEVATPDRPFLLSTVVDELERTGHAVLRSLHPTVGVERGTDGRITAIVPARDAIQRESLLHLELAGPLHPGEEAKVVTELERLLDDVMRATDDHDAMRDRIRAVAQELREGRWPRTDPTETTEVAALLDWLLDDNLVLLGLREYAVTEVDGRPAVAVVEGSGLGLLGDTSRSRYATPVPLEELPRTIQARYSGAILLSVTRTSARSTVQRRARMEDISLTRRRADGTAEREVRILGLFTRKGYAEPARTTPVLREKLRTILELEDVVPGSHDEVTLTSMFQALPKDELFQADTDEMHRTLVGLLHAEEHREVRTLVRVDHHTHTVSVLVAVPRDRYTAELRQRIEAELARQYGTGRIDVEVALGDRQEALARFLLHTDGDIPEIPLAQLQTAIRALARSWIDTLRERLIVRFGELEAERLLMTLGRRMPRAYRDVTSPTDAVDDLVLLDNVVEEEASLLLSVRPSDDDGQADNQVRLRAAKRGRPLELSAFIPTLESLGLVVVEEIPHRLTGNGTEVTLHDFGVRVPQLDLGGNAGRLTAAILAAWRGHLEVDALNQLVVVAGTDWRDVGILRAYRRLRRQLGTAYTPNYVNATLVGHPEVVTALLAYFHARFDPQVGATDEEQATARQQVLEVLDALVRLDHDRILRGLLHLVDATLRTNAFRADAVADGSGEPYVAFKLDSSAIPDVPHPVPYREIFVHSTRVEGIHLRAGSVARGGLRWSDRRDDVRTEVLDLVKAQVLKNALIVPTGAKGGFVVTREPADPGELRDEVRRQYVTFIRGLLDVTDDLDGDRVVPPPDVIRHDGDDPYLVVAADRGTATFSDTANAVAARYGFWLDDAFASGGSNGYDHKALGVTARGAWVAVQRHFRELGVDVQSDPFSVVGVGDMSGDVFGNGLLRSRTARLLAAFDHRHIFLDPDPDPERSFEERQRLFDLPRSSWADYDPSLISPGGGVFPRASRSIELSAQLRGLLRVDADALSPPALIRAILQAPVDLLFAGGIGTYVKASSERNEDVGDRVNDELRVDASEVRARVIAEGANLFITQRARIELARRGGNLNQDAIDNAAGVSTSDLEVNLKILLRLAQEEGLIDRDERDRFLAELAEDVVADVLTGVDRQTAGLSRESARSPEHIDAYGQLMERLTQRSEFDRDAEVLPNDDALRSRRDAGAGLTRPELATLLAWSKRELKEALLASDVPDSPLCRTSLDRAFPRRAVERFGHLAPRHRLRPELIATVLANDVVDRMGVTFASQLAISTASPLAQVVRSFQAARQIVDADRRWAQLDELDAMQDPARVRELEAPVERLLVALTTVLLTEPSTDHPEDLVAGHRAVVADVLAGISTLGTTDQRRARIAHARWLIDDLVDPELARFLACARDLALTPDVAAVMDSIEGDRRPADVVDALLRLGDALGIDRLEDDLVRARPQTRWGRRQRQGLFADLRRTRRDAALTALRRHPDRPEAEAIASFLDERADAVARTRLVVAEADRTDGEPLDAVAVAARSVRDAIDRGND